MGFQHMPKIVHEAASRKGGEINTKKGLAKLSPERRKAIASQGGKSGNNSRNKAIKKKDNSSMEGLFGLERVYRDLDGHNDTRTDTQPEEQ